jgi:uridine phosphorylase
MKKEKYPILEFDDTKEALIEPSFIKRKNFPDLPKRLIITFFKEVILSLLNDGDITPYLTLTGENTLEIYKYKDSDVAIFHGIIGGAACGGFLEECIALGVEHVMFCGGAGSLIKEITVGKLMIVEKAIRDEGFSYHYLKPSRYVEANPNVNRLIERHLKDKHIEYIKGTIWTTDAFYRETKDKIQLRIQDGALLVDMEQAGLLALAKFRGFNYGAIIYSGDDVSGDIWDSRGWHKRSDIRFNLVKLCKDILLDMHEVYQNL